MPQNYTEKENTWVEKVCDNVYIAHCTVCWNVSGGLTDVKQQASSGGHMRNMRDTNIRGTLDQVVDHQARGRYGM